MFGIETDDNEKISNDILHCILFTLLLFLDFFEKITCILLRCLYIYASRREFVVYIK